MQIIYVKGIRSKVFSTRPPVSLKVIGGQESEKIFASKRKDGLI
jgi:hypothetical protein